jgi:hypothetical protein
MLEDTDYQNGTDIENNFFVCIHLTAWVCITYTHSDFYGFMCFKWVLLLLSVGLPVANAPDVLQPCGLLYCP